MLSKEAAELKRTETRLGLLKNYTSQDITPKRNMSDKLALHLSQLAQQRLIAERVLPT